MTPKKSEFNEHENGSSDNINVYEKSKGIIIDGNELNDINAEIVKMNNSSAKNISAKNTAKLERSAAKNVITQSCEAKQTAAYKISAEKAKFSETIIGFNDSKESITDKSINVVSVNDTTHASTFNSVVTYSSEIKAGEIRSAVFVGKNVNGNVQTLLTAQTAAIAGACLGAVFFILKLIFGRD